jgi:ribosome-associated protein
MHDPPDNATEPGAERPSKSELKRRSDDLQALGESLIDLPQAELDSLPLPEKLRDAVELARRITKHGGLYRQKQYIGKLMRKADVEPIRAALEARGAAQRKAALEFKRIEAWRDRLLRDEPGTLDALRETFPDADVAMISKLAERARQERARGESPRAARELFKRLRELADGR